MGPRRHIPFPFIAAKLAGALFGALLVVLGIGKIINADEIARQAAGTPPEGGVIAVGVLLTTIGGLLLVSFLGRIRAFRSGGGRGPGGHRGGPGGHGRACHAGGPPPWAHGGGEGGPPWKHHRGGKCAPQDDAAESPPAPDA